MLLGNMVLRHPLHHLLPHQHQDIMFQHMYHIDEDTQVMDTVLTTDPLNMLVVELEV